MSELNYIDANELVFNNDKENGIYSGGFDVGSIMMKAGISPIMTMNVDVQSGGSERVSDLFSNLVIPSWLLSYNNRIVGGGKNRHYKKGGDDDDESDEEYEIIEDDLHDKLLDLVKEPTKEHEKASDSTTVTGGNAKKHRKTRRPKLTGKRTTKRARSLKF